MKRKHAPRALVRGGTSRSPVATERSTFRLPTIAMIASALALTAAPSTASAVIRTTDAGAEDVGVEDAAADADGDAGTGAEIDAAMCPPPLGGVPIPTRVHGSGCGCGGEGSDSGSAGLAAAGAFVAMALQRRRRRSP